MIMILSLSLSIKVEVDEDEGDNDDLHLFMAVSCSCYQKRTTLFSFFELCVHYLSSLFRSDPFVKNLHLPSKLTQQAIPSSQVHLERRHCYQFKVHGDEKLFQINIEMLVLKIPPTQEVSSQNQDRSHQSLRQGWPSLELL